MLCASIRRVTIFTCGIHVQNVERSCESRHTPGRHVHKSKLFQKAPHSKVHCRTRTWTRSSITGIPCYCCLLLSKYFTKQLLIMFNVLPNPNKRYRPTILTYFTVAQTLSMEFFFNNLMPGPKGTESCCTQHLSWSSARPTRNMQLAHLTALSIQTSMDLH